MKLQIDGLRLQLLGLIILPFSLLLLAFALGGVRVHQDAMRNLVAERDERAVRAASAALSEQLHHRQAAVRSLAHRLMDGASPQAALEQATYLEQDFDGGMVILNLEGERVASRGAIETWIEAMPELLSPIPEEAEVLLSEPFLDPQRGMMLWVSSRGDGWIIAGAFSLAQLLRNATLGPTPGADGYSAFLADGEGRILASMGSPPAEEPLMGHPGLQAALRGETGSSYLPAEDSEHVVAFSPVPPLTWALIIEEPWERVASPILDLSLIAPLALVPALAVTLLALWFGSRRIVGPLRQLERQASRLADGDYQAVEEPAGGIAEIQHLQGTLILMTQRIQAAQQALRGYISTMTRTQEDERRRLSRELHDETIQDLIALSHKLQKLGKRIRELGQGDMEELNQLQASTQEAIQRVRRLTRGLRPIYLEDVGLAPALEMLARDTEMESGIAIGVQTRGEVQRLPAETELAIYRIVQEALSNVTRHAQAQNVQLQLNFLEQEVGIAIRDDGIGFALPPQMSDLARSGHYGLIGMVERATLIGAQLDIQSQPGSGTQISIRLPLANVSLSPEA